MLPAKFGLIWPSSFRGEEFYIISQSETRTALGGHVDSFRLANKYGCQEQFLFLIG
jgi:hypothetical protein